MILRRLLRGIAVALAVLGVIDPVVRADRTVAHQIAIVDTGVAGSASPSLTADAVSRQLGRTYEVVNGPSIDAAATVVVGDRLPSSTVSGPAFAVRPAATGPWVVITRLNVPSRSSFETRVPVQVEVRVRRARGQRVVVALESAAGTIDRIERPVDGDDVTMQASLDFIPSSTGVVRVVAAARLAGNDVPARASALVRIDDSPRPILFFERQPSWSSTFVRRALERDRRFAVSSRTGTSPAITTDRGDPPASLADRASVDRYDVIVVGSPAALTASDVDGLESFARRRGGSIVLLIDDTNLGAAARLLDVSQWRASGTAQSHAVEVTEAVTAAFEGSEWITPDPLPARVTTLARIAVGGSPRAVVFERPLGAGRLLASGAADAWRYRGVPGASVFDRFWQTTIAGLAAASPAAILVEPSRSFLAPGESTTVRVTVRDAALEPPTASPPILTMRATADGPTGTATLRLWPDGAPGRFAGEFRAPAAPGVYQIIATSGADRGEVPVLVSAEASRATADDDDAIAAWAAARGGRVFEASEVADLEPALATVLRPERRQEPVRPLRSPLWIAVFAAALGGEWWMRRRHDQR